jgi:hypothetical protein
MKKVFLWLGMVTLLATSVPAIYAQFNMAGAWPALASDTPRDTAGASPSLPDINLVYPVVLPRMSPELALETYEQRSREQATKLLAYSDDTVMKAELPDTRQQGEYELKREYSAPNSLQFKVVRFVGDGFVKTNVLVRLLQSEVDHVNKQQGSETAISEQNYKFNHKAVDWVNGRMAYVYHVKPRKKRVGLFKGKIYIDAYTGALLRAEGQMVKSPSIFIKNIEFVQDYSDIDGFILPVHLHTVAKVRIIGRTIVDVFHSAYKARTLVAGNTASTNPASAGVPVATSATTSRSN